MKVGCYPSDKFSGRKDFEIEEIKNLSEVSEKGLVLLFVHSSSSEEDYWEGLKKCALENPRVTFSIYYPSEEEIEFAKKIVGERINVEYLTGKKLIRRCKQFLTYKK